MEGGRRWKKKLIGRNEELLYSKELSKSMSYCRMI